MSRSVSYITNPCAAASHPICAKSPNPHHLNGSTIHRQISAKMATAQLLKSKGIFSTHTYTTPNLPGTKRHVPIKESTRTTS